MNQDLKEVRKRVAKISKGTENCKYKDPMAGCEGLRNSK